MKDQNLVYFLTEVRRIFSCLCVLVLTANKDENVYLTLSCKSVWNSQENTISHEISSTSWCLSKWKYHDSMFSYSILVLWILVFA